MVKFCSNCKKIIPIFEKNCPFCKNKNLFRYCQNCKRIIRPSENACPLCGDIDPTTDTATQKTTQKQIHSTNKKAAITMFFVVTITAITIIVFDFVVPYFDPCKDGHIWKDGTCTDPLICLVCGKTDGRKIGHNWDGGTCTIPRVCSRCGEAGDTLSHRYSKGFCTECGRLEDFYTFTEQIDEDSYWSAITAAKILVKEKLKSPSTAKFPASSSEYLAQKAEDENIWVVSGYVDAKNGFGATIRTKWIATFTLGAKIGGEQKITDYSVVFP